MKTTDFLEQIIPIKDKELKNLLVHACRIDSFRQGQSINEVWEKDYYIRFLISGVVRGYIINNPGEETTVDFALQPGSLIAGSRMLDGSASEISLEALEECELFSIPINVINDLRTKYQEIADLQTYLLAQSALRHWNLRKMLYMKSARERYDWLTKEWPDLTKRVKHKYIASFLGISPVTLSRIINGSTK